MTQVAAHQYTIADREAGGLDTLHRMRQIIRAQIALPVVRLTTAQIVAGTGTDAARQVYLIRNWLSSHIGFLRDPDGHELLQDPATVLAMVHAHGAADVDCDDVAMLGAAMGLSIGLRAQLELIGAWGGYSHVWADLSSPMRIPEWQDLDITRPWQVDYSQYPLQLAVEV